MAAISSEWLSDNVRLEEDAGAGLAPRAVLPRRALVRKKLLYGLSLAALLKVGGVLKRGKALRADVRSLARGAKCTALLTLARRYVSFPLGPKGSF